jgi:predicted small secreted protein
MKRFRLIYMLAVAAVMFLAACQNDSPGCTIDEVAAALSAVIFVNGKLNYNEYLLLRCLKFIK